VHRALFTLKQPTGPVPMATVTAMVIIYLMLLVAMCRHRDKGWRKLDAKWERKPLGHLRWPRYILHHSSIGLLLLTLHFFIEHR
jgi:hypothetical protein